jgi:hypothetical protein
MKTEITLGVLSVLLLLLISSASGGPRDLQQPQSCRNRPDVVGKCFAVHGRLSVYNGTPSIRLWPMGTKRLLGVIDPGDPSNAPGPTILPIEIKNKLDWNKDVFGDFSVCPLTRQRSGRMQTICIESGKNLVVREHKLEGR